MTTTDLFPSLIKPKDLDLGADSVVLLYCVSGAMTGASSFIPGSRLCNVSKITSLSSLHVRMRQLDVTGKRVICYQSSGLDIAAQVWWLLKVIGHDFAQVLDGGFKTWTDFGYPSETGLLEDQDQDLSSEGLSESQIDRSKYKVDQDIRSLLTANARNFQLLDTDGKYFGATNCPYSLLMLGNVTLGDVDSLQLVLAGLNIKFEPLLTTIVIGKAAPVVLLALSVLGMRNLCLGVVNRTSEDEDFLALSTSGHRSKDIPASNRTEFYSISGNTEYFDAVEEDQRSVQKYSTLFRDSLVTRRASNKVTETGRVSTIVRKPEMGQEHQEAETQHTCSSCEIC